MNRFALAALTAAGAVITLSACTTPVTAPPATPATTTPAATTPAATPPATKPAVKPVATKPSWKSVDFKKVTDGEMPHCPQATEVDSVHFADLTGDGRDEAIVAAACFTTTAQNPINVFVYDGQDRRAPLERLVTIGKDQYLQTAEVRTSGRTITVTSNALSSKAPRCCPDLRITQKYEWTGSAFKTVSMDQKPL